MVELEKLITLEKNPADVDIRYCEIIADVMDEEKNERARILREGAEFPRYYYHKMRCGEVVDCFEIALSWKPLGKIYVFAYTPDNRHEYEIDVRRGEDGVFRIGKPSVIPISTNVIEIGDRCEFRGHTVEIVAEDAINFDGRTLPVVSDSGYTFKLLKTKIRAKDGARGLFRFLDEIAERGKFEKFPLFDGVYDMMAKKYGGG